jgi:type I restriction enzyme R subunit
MRRRRSAWRIGASARGGILRGSTSETDTARFKIKVRQFLDAHRDHIAFQKVRRAEQLTRQDVEELERMLVDEGVADEGRLGALRSAGGLGVFLRSLLGLDRRAAKEAFSAVLDLGSMTASQLQFIDLILNYLTERGVIEPAILYESPFTDINDQGLTGVFSQEDSKLIIEVIGRLSASAAA